MPGGAGTNEPDDATIGAVMATIRVALAEDHVLLREDISRLVSGNEDFELVGVASDLPELLAIVAEQRPDVVVTDIRMPPTGTDEGIKAAGWIYQNYPHTSRGPEPVRRARLCRGAA
jgi:DNA-binding NarL/FixJ family response regulator